MAHICEVAQSLFFIASTLCTVSLQEKHVKAHCDHPWNSLADYLRTYAKYRRMHITSICPCKFDRMSIRRLSLAVVVMSHRSSEYTFSADVEPPTAWLTLPPSVLASDYGRGTEETIVSSVSSVDFNIATYNVLTAITVSH